MASGYDESKIVDEVDSKLKGFANPPGDGDTGIRGGGLTAS